MLHLLAQTQVFSGMLFFVRTDFFSGWLKSYQRLESTLTLEFSFILTKYIMWLPNKKPCVMPPCTRTPAWSGFTLAVLSNLLKMVAFPYPCHFLWPLWSIWRTAACSGSVHVCSRLEVRKSTSDACHGNLSRSSSSPADLKSFLGLRHSDYIHVQN